MGVKMTVYCDRCGNNITLEPYQHINLGQSKERDLCMGCYGHISQKLAEIDYDIFFGEKERKKNDKRGTQNN